MFVLHGCASFHEVVRGGAWLCSIVLMNTDPDITDGIAAQAQGLQQRERSEVRTERSGAISTDGIAALEQALQQRECREVGSSVAAPSSMMRFLCKFRVYSNESAARWGPSATAPSAPI